MALLNRGFETAGSSFGLAANWSVTIVANGQKLYDFGASNGDPPKPIEDFERGWGCDTFLFAFSGGNAAVLFDSGTNPIEGFEAWAPGYGFALSQSLAVIFTGTGQTVLEDFEGGWGCDAASYLLVLSGDATVTFDEGTDTEEFGDTLIASVVASTSTFTVSQTPDNGTPIAFRSPAPSGTTAGTTYYVSKLSGNTFQIATFPGGGIVTIGADATGIVLDVVGPRTVLPFGDTSDFTIGHAPGGLSNVEDFEGTAGTFGHLAVDTVANTITAAGHTFITNQPIVFTGPGIPTSSPPIAEGITYYAVSVVTGVSFKVSQFSGGGPVTLTGPAGSGATVSGDPTVYWNELLS